MSRITQKIIELVLIVVSLNGGRCAVNWDGIRCSTDAEQAVPEGKVPDIARFPWLGVVQHTFYLGGKTRFAVTNGVLVHPAFVVAPAEDIARIQPGALANNTKFIVWKGANRKYSLGIDSYYLPPEYTDGETLASIALLHIMILGQQGSRAPVPPICMPVKGLGTFQDLYAVKMTDETGEVEKEVLKMNFVEEQDCEEFYYTHKLNLKTMSPVNSICAVSARRAQPCVWDGGVALVSRQAWGFWKLIGFSVRGPGCGAPARFLFMHDYLFWIDQVISQQPLEDPEEEHMFILRRVSPIKLTMYSPKIRHPKNIGQCDRKLRGGVLFKDNSELLVSKNFAQGFYFVSMHQVAQVNCVQVLLDVSSRTNAAVWMEHYCHKDLTGDRRGKVFRDLRQNECFLYFKSAAYLEFRFYFSFKANLEITIYGIEEIPKFVPSPFHMSESTYPWMPTYGKMRVGAFVPQYAWWYSM